MKYDPLYKTSTHNQVKHFILDALKQKKIQPSYQITIGCDHFKLQSSPEDKRTAIHKLAKSLPQRVYKKLLNQRYPLDTEFKNMIMPERMGKTGIDVGWHLHIVLFLTPEEKIIYRLHRKQICHIISNQSLKFFKNVDVNHSRVKDFGFVNYVLKNCEETFDIIVSNHL